MVYKPTYNWGDPSCREVNVVLFVGTLGLQIQEVNVQVVGRHQLETPGQCTVQYTPSFTFQLYANGSGAKTSHYYLMDSFVSPNQCSQTLVLSQSSSSLVFQDVKIYEIYRTPMFFEFRSHGNPVKS